MSKKNIAFTIIAQNYLPYAVTLAKSMKESNPEIEFMIIFADDLNNEIKSYLNESDISGKSIFELCSKENDAILDMAFYYEVTEYCTAIKPFVMQQFLLTGYETVTYIDPDIYVYNSFENPILNILKTQNIILTPHVCSPIYDDAKPDEQAHLKSGTYNLGFISISNSKTTQGFIEWWKQKCFETCFNDSASGLFVDQKWINLVPGMFEGVYISRNLGLNVAYWNLHERKIINHKINDIDELVFFHYSGFVKNDLNCISKYQNRYSLSDRVDLEEYFVDYKNKFEITSNNISDLPKYKFSNYSTNQTISLLARRFYYWNKGEIENPFNNQSAELEFLKLLRISGIKEEFVNSGISDPEKINKNARIVNKIMKMILKVVGPNKYASLCKYFGYLSSLQNHIFIMPSQKNIDVVDAKRKHLKR